MTLNGAPRPAGSARPPRAPAFILGLGLGGFIDGIGFLLTGENGGRSRNTVAGLEANTLADGFFHLATWLLVAAASWLLVRAWQRGALAPPWRMHVGMVLAGWGAFDVVEGVIDHQILGLHHVRDDLGGPLGWDLAFLALGALLIAGGRALSAGAVGGAPAGGGSSPD
jgi:uncharacterized membrane protein